MESMLVVGGLIIMIILLLLVGIPERLLKVISEIVIKGLMGALLLFLVNIIGQQVGVHVPINYLTVIISGFLGIPGVLSLIIIKSYFIS